MADVLSRSLLASYRIAGTLVSPFAGSLILARARKGKEDLPRRRERFGYAGSRKPNGSLIWVHAASVGETVAILPLIKRIEETGSYVVLTTGTVTSAQLAAKQIGPRTLHQYAPLDLAPFVNRFLNTWKPQLAIFVESELWPATFHALAKRNIPHVLVNARMSERSFFRWRRASGLIGAMLSSVTLCLAQTVDDAERFRVLGAPRVRVTGNLKFDTPAPADNPAQLKLLEQTLRGRKVWLASSTHPGEEAIALRVHKALKHHLPDLLTVIVPRHPERGREVAGLALSEGLSHTLRSEGHLPKADTDVYIADTIGEMGLHYRLAPVSFIGGSLVRHGGQNPIEPAKLQTAILHGPDVHNFPEIYTALNSSDATIEVDSAEMLARSVGRLLVNEREREKLCSQATKAIQEFEGALSATMDAIEPLLTAFSVSAALEQARR
ncbi:MAG: 3-deoxy-D-manno-octulosonic acid transferase [Hyphomicrobiales bacterium]|jgi:3-deoxy-D-manno-octulosonic-acid transferase